MGCVGWRDCSTQDMVAEPFCIHRPCRGPCVTAGLHACAVCRGEVGAGCGGNLLLLCFTDSTQVGWGWAQEPPISYPE